MNGGVEFLAWIGAITVTAALLVLYVEVWNGLAMLWGSRRRARKGERTGIRREGGKPEGEWIEKGIEHAAETGHAHAPATIEGDAGTASEEDETP